MSAKNSHALFEIFAALRGRITRLVVGIVPPKEVEDIVQETYVRVCQIENKDTIREPHSFMFRTARNLALDYLKRAETRLTSGVDAIDEIEFLSDSRLADTTYAEASSDEEFSQFCDAVRHLPQQCRRAFVLKNEDHRQEVELCTGDPSLMDDAIAAALDDSDLLSFEQRAELR